MPRNNRTIQPLVSLPPELTPEIFITTLNQKIEEINNSFTSLDMMESELRGEEGNIITTGSNISLSGKRVTGASPSRNDNDYVTRGELRMNSLYADHTRMLSTNRMIETTRGLITPPAGAPEQAPNLGQIASMMTGMVRGPASSTDNAIARWDGTTGQLLEDSTISAAILNLTDNTGATANDTIENIPASTGDGGGAATVSAAANVATVASVNTALTAIENDIADLTAKVNLILAALRAVFVITP